MKKLLIIVNLLFLILLITNLTNIVFNNLTVLLIVVGITLLLPISFCILNINRLVFYSKEDYLALAEDLNITDGYTEFTSMLYTEEMKNDNDAENAFKIIQKNAVHYFLITIFGIVNGLLCYIKYG